MRTNVTLAREKSLHLLPNDDHYLLMIYSQPKIALQPLARITCNLPVNFRWDRMADHCETCHDTAAGSFLPSSDSFHNKYVTECIAIHDKRNDTCFGVDVGLCMLCASGFGHPNGFGAIGRQLRQHEASKYFGRDLNARVIYGTGSHRIMKKNGELRFVMNGLRESSRFGCTWEFLKIGESCPIAWAVIRYRPLTII